MVQYRLYRFDSNPFRVTNCDYHKNPPYLTNIIRKIRWIGFINLWSFLLPAEHQLSGRSIGERCGNEKPQRVPFGEDILGTGVQGKAGFYGLCPLRAASRPSRKSRSTGRG